MDPDAGAAVAVRLSERDAAGALVRRLRLCWACSPPAADVVRAVAERQLAARRAGHHVTVDEATGGAAVVLALAGLSGQDVGQP